MLHPLVPPDGYGTRLTAGFDGDVEDHGRMGEGLRRIGNGKGISPPQPAHYLGCKLHAWVRPTRPRPHKDGVKLEDDLER